MNRLNRLVKEKLAALCQEKGIPVLWDEPMKYHTSFKIGGPAAVMCIPKDSDQLFCALDFARRENLPVWYVGNGSNLLVKDERIDGMVILLDSEFGGEIAVEGETLIAPSGKKLSAVCAAAAKESLTGLEFAWGIPGSVGGAVYMNAGAYGGEMKDCLLWAEYLSPQGKIVHLSKEDLALSYRHSCFMQPQYKDCCIVRAAFSLTKGEPEAIRQQMDHVMEQRKAKQPLEYPSAGSTFKRPQGAFAAQLIDQCGLRGTQVGGAQVSTKHAGFVINLGDACCNDVLNLTAQVRECVKQQTGYELELEVRLIP